MATRQLADVSKLTFNSAQSGILLQQDTEDDLREHRSYSRRSRSAVFTEFLVKAVVVIFLLTLAAVCVSALHARYSSTSVVQASAAALHASTASPAPLPASAGPVVCHTVTVKIVPLAMPIQQNADEARRIFVARVPPEGALPDTVGLWEDLSSPASLTCLMKDSSIVHTSCGNAIDAVRSTLDCRLIAELLDNGAAHAEISFASITAPIKCTLVICRNPHSTASSVHTTPVPVEPVTDIPPRLQKIQ